MDQSFIELPLLDISIKKQNGQIIVDNLPQPPISEVLLGVHVCGRCQ